MELLKAQVMGSADASFGDLITLTNGKRSGDSDTETRSGCQSPQGVGAGKPSSANAAAVEVTGCEPGGEGPALAPRLMGGAVESTRAQRDGIETMIMSTVRLPG